MGRCTSLVGLKGGGGGRRGVIQCGICYGSVAMKGGGGGVLVNEVERVGEGRSMLISVVDALTCNMGLIA